MCVDINIHDPVPRLYFNNSGFHGCDRPSTRIQCDIQCDKNKRFIQKKVFVSFWFLLNF